MPAMNYKEATGVRARADLSANVVPSDSGRMTDDQLVTVASWLAEGAEKGLTRKLKPETSGRLADVILEVVNRGREP
jgi:hypothetical protein